MNNPISIIIRGFMRLRRYRWGQIRRKTHTKTQLRTNCSPTIIGSAGFRLFRHGRNVFFLIPSAMGAFSVLVLTPITPQQRCPPHLCPQEIYADLPLVHASAFELLFGVLLQVVLNSLL